MRVRKATLPHKIYFGRTFGRYGAYYQEEVIDYTGGYKEVTLCHYMIPKDHAGPGPSIHWLQQTHKYELSWQQMSEILLHFKERYDKYYTPAKAEPMERKLVELEPTPPPAVPLSEDYYVE